MTDIPDAAIEAAAEAFSVVRGTIDERARAAIEAAMPAIREHIAREIGSKVPRDAPLSDYMHGMIAAREIVWDGVP